MWRFAYPPVTDHRLLTVQETEIVKAASRHGRNLQWLRDRSLLPPATMDSDKPKPVAEALVLWQEQLGAVPSDREVPRELLLNSLHACVYLRQTRSLLWLASETGWYSLPDLTKTQWQSLLQAEIAAAEGAMDHALRLLATDRSILPCESDAYRQLAQRLREAVTKLAQTAERTTGEVSSRRP